MQLLFTLETNFVIAYSKSCFDLLLGDSCDFKKIGIWSNCGYSNTTSKECATLKCCYANDAFLVSKNLTQKCVQPPDR